MSDATDNRTGRTDNPYKGPRAFGVEDMLYGREKESSELFNMLMAERIVLLYSPSGSGKTSLIQAELIPQLRAKRFRVLGPMRVGLERVTTAEVMQSHSNVNQYIASALQSLEAHLPAVEQLGSAELTGLGLKGYLQRRGWVGKNAGKMVMIFDQFEEILTVNPNDRNGKRMFFEHIGELLREPDEGQPIWALFSMREEFIAALEQYLRPIPTRLGNTLRIDRLDTNNAELAIKKPAELKSLPFTRDALKQLVEDLSKEQVQLLDGKTEIQIGGYVEPVQLQVVCYRLWEKLPGNTTSISPSELSLLGKDISSALGDYYNDCVRSITAEKGVSERNLRRWIERKLITDQGIRNQALKGEEEPSLEKAISALIDSYLVRIEKRRNATWYELSHDRLVEPVQQANKAWYQQNEAPLQHQAALWEKENQPKSLLFHDELLKEAERWADVHKDELEQYEKEFLAACQKAREKTEEDKRKREEIKERNKQLEEKNKLIEKRNDQLLSERLKLLVGGVLLFVVATGAFYWAYDNSNKKEEIKQKNYQLIENNKQLVLTDNENMRLLSINQGVESDLVNSLSSSQLLQAVAMAREGRGIEALNVLCQATEIIKKRKLDKMHPRLDISLLEILGKMPPILLEVGIHSPIVRAVQFRSDGMALFSGGWDKKLKIWHLDNKEKDLVEDEHKANIYSFAYHAGKQILASTDEAGRIIIWRVADSKLEKLSILNADREEHKDRVTGAAFNPEGSLLATVSWDKKIVLWKVSDPAAPSKLALFGSHYHHAPIYRTAFLEGGKHAGKLATADLEGKVGLWSVPKVEGSMNREPDFAMNTKEIIQKPVGIYSMACDPTGRWLATGNSDGDVIVWDLEAADPKISGKCLNPKLSHQDKIFGMAFSPSGRTLVTVGSDEILLKWDIPKDAKNVTDFEKKVRVRRVNGWGEKLYSIAFNPKGDCIVAVGGSTKVRIADLNQPNPLSTVLETSDRIVADWHVVAMTSDSSLLAALTSDQKSIYFWRNGVEGFRPVETLTISAPAKLSGMAMHPNRSTIATLSCEGELTLWKITENSYFTPSILTSPSLKEKTCPKAALSFSHDGRLLAVAMGKKLNLWSDSGTGLWQEFPLAMLEKNINYISFSLSNEFLAIAGEAGNIRVWKISGGKANPEYHEPPEFLGEDLFTLSFSPDGQTLVTGGTDFIVREWKLPNLEKSGQSALHKRAVTSFSYGLRKDIPVLFSADREGQIVACPGGISDEKCVRIGRPRGMPIHSLAASADLNQLVVAGGGLWVWNLNFEGMLKTAEHLVEKKQ